MLDHAKKVLLLCGALVLLGCEGTAGDCSADSDGDGVDDCTEDELGTDPELADSDGDGFTDGEEADCVSDPLDATEVCYACGWAHNDPGDLQSDGNSEGNVVANMALIDQCLDEVELWDFAGSYVMLFMTATW